jgi:hypothetical protein
MNNRQIETALQVYREKIAHAKKNMVEITEGSLLHHDNVLGSDVAQAQQSESPAELSEAQRSDSNEEDELHLPIICWYVTPTPAQVMANESIRTKVLLEGASRIMLDKQKKK